MKGDLSRYYESERVKLSSAGRKFKTLQVGSSEFYHRTGFDSENIKCFFSTKSVFHLMK